MSADGKINGYCKGETVAAPQEDIVIPRSLFGDSHATLIRLRDSIDDMKTAMKEG